MIAVLEQIKPETAELIANNAQQQGLAIDDYLRSLLLPERQAPESLPQVAEPSPEERARQWNEFIARHAVRIDHFVDVSRESIYTREDEIL